MFCSQCGTQLEDGSNFCPSCGAPIAPAAAEEAVEQTAGEAAEQVAEQAPEEVVEQAVEQPVEEAVEQVAEQPAEQAPVEQPAEQTLELPVEQPFEQTAVQQPIAGPAAADATQPQPVAQAAAPAAQAAVEGKAPRRLSPAAIGGIVAAVVVVVVLVTVLVYKFVLSPSSEQAPEQAADSAAQEQPANESEQQAQEEPQLTAEQKLIASYAGWWAGDSVQGGQLMAVCFITEDGKTYGYTWDNSKQSAEALDGNPGQFTLVSRFENEQLPEGSLFEQFGHAGTQSGWHVSFDGKSSDAIDLRIFDGDTEYIGDGSSVNSYKRIVNLPDGLAKIEEQITADNGKADQPAAQEVDPKVAANQAKVDEAAAAGKQVIAGTIHNTTNDGAWKMLIGTNPNDDPNYSQRNEDWYQESLYAPVTLFVFDQDRAISGLQYSGDGYKQVVNSDARFNSVGANAGIDLPDSFSSYDGQHVVMAFTTEEISFPTDVSRIKAKGGEVLFTGDTTGVTIPGSGGTNTAAVSNSSYSGDYVLPDSDKRVYSVSEIRGMNLSKDQLRIARNEIFARHGRGFNDAGLQGYFNSKSWYKRQYEPGDFEEDKLSSTERENIKNIKALEG